MNRYSLAWHLFSGVCLTVMGVGWIVAGLRDEVRPMQVGVGAFLLLGAVGYFFVAYRRTRGTAVNR